MTIRGLCTGILALVGAGLLSGGALAGGNGWRWPALPGGVSRPVVPADNAMTAQKVALGRMLFYDSRLSRDGTLACAGCHIQARGFTDGLPTHIGVTGESGIRNVPGLANVAWRSPLTWTDASLTTLEAQAMVPMTGEHPVEMGMNGREAEIAARLGEDSCIARMTGAAFPGSAGRIDFARITAALAAFQRTLISFDSPYDRYRAGRTDALSPQARRGAAQFKSAGCAACHGGADLTDNQFHYTGTAAATIGGLPSYSAPPLAGPQEVTQFRTPSLRNVAVTGPWLHDGSSDSMESAIRRHAAGSLASLTMTDMIAFLTALTDEAFLRNPAFAKPGPACPVPA